MGGILRRAVSKFTRYCHANITTLCALFLLLYYHLPVFTFPSNAATKHNVRNPRASNIINYTPLSRKPNAHCRVVSFISGGKCGSTSLALLLKHQPPLYSNWFNLSGFVDAGKELCGFNVNCRGNLAILDACPVRLTHSRAKTTLAVDPNAVAVLLVRNQAMALLSRYRDVLSSGPSRLTADEWVLKNALLQEYNFTAAWRDAMNWGFKNIIVVNTNDLQDPNSIVAKIKRLANIRVQYNVTPIISNNAHSQSSRYRPGQLSLETIAYVNQMWKETNHELFLTTGKGV